MRVFQDADFTLIAAVAILVCFGLVMVYTSSAVVIGEIKSDSLYYFKKQFIWTLLGLIFFTFFLITDYKKLQKFIIPFTIITFLLLLGVLLFGTPIRNARRWFTFSYFHFQPSELAKFMLILFIADYLDKNKSRLKYFSTGFLPPFLVTAGMAVLIALQPDLGIPVIMMISAIFLFFIGGGKITHIMFIIALGIPALIYELRSHPYRLDRLKSFIEPWKYYSDGYSYQLVQSLTSLGSGGILGKGAGASEISRFYIPDAHTDFIFTVIGEEFGVLGAVSVLILFCIILQRGYTISKHSRDNFGTLLAAGITLIITIQAFFNIAVCTGCLPTKGLTLPFVSYGGSSIFFNLCAAGILANISANGRKVIKLR